MSTKPTIEVVQDFLKIFPKGDVDLMSSTAENQAESKLLMEQAQEVIYSAMEDIVSDQIDDAIQKIKGWENRNPDFLFQG
ncbi:MAG TPA: hypothetical protein VIY47_06310, partial [Ignavibacteriaceae bacterium]